MTPNHVLVAMSGGVDSAVCAHLLQERGFSLTGITMRLWADQETIPDAPNPTPDQNCLDAKAVADRLGFPHRSVALGESFRRDVIEPFICAYAEGNTPNPCVNCNRALKFGKLLTLADDLGCSHLATGHYAKIEQSASGEFLLKKAADTAKDQSYFLWSIDRRALSRILLPLGSYTKNEIRAIAEAHALPCAHRSDSQDICFIPDGDYISFIQKHSDLTFPEGNFIAPDGRVLGRHSGIIRYTVGQRKGLGIALGHPAFVAEKNIVNNTVTLCSDAELYRDRLTAHSLNLLVSHDLCAPLRVEAKIRYRHTAAPATVERIGEDRISVQFDEPQRAIAAGQSVVLYDTDTVLGGAIIE